MINLLAHLTKYIGFSLILFSIGCTSTDPCKGLPDNQCFSSKLSEPIQKRGAEPCTLVKTETQTFCLDREDISRILQGDT